MQRWCLVPCLALTLACDGDTDETPSVVCGDNPPTFDDFSLTDQGEVDFGGGPRRAVQFGAQGNDIDGNLDRYVAFVWVDTFVDGEVDGLRDFEIQTQVAEERCSISDVFVGAVLPLGERVPFGSDIEFGLVIEDADGFQSNDGEPIIWVGRTPDE